MDGTPKTKQKQVLRSLRMTISLLQGVPGGGLGRGGVGLGGVGWALGEDLLELLVIAVEVVEEVDVAVLGGDGGEVEDDDGDGRLEVELTVVGAVGHGVVDVAASHSPATGPGVAEWLSTQTARSSGFCTRTQPWEKSRRVRSKSSGAGVEWR